MMLATPEPEHSLGSLLGMTTKLLGKLLEKNFQQAGYPFSLEHWLILLHLWKEDGQVQNQLAQECGRSKTAVTRAIDRLEQQNYVLRVPDQHDKRHKRVYLTHQGKCVQQALYACAHQTLEKACEGIEQQELNACRKVLIKMFHNLQYARN